MVRHYFLLQWATSILRPSESGPSSQIFLFIKWGLALMIHLWLDDTFLKINVSSWKKCHIRSNYCASHQAQDLIKDTLSRRLWLSDLTSKFPALENIPVLWRWMPFSACTLKWIDPNQPMSFFPGCSKYPEYHINLFPKNLFRLLTSMNILFIDTAMSIHRLLGDK